MQNYYSVSYFVIFQDDDRRRKPNLEILRGHKLSANTDSRSPSTVPATNSVSPTDTLSHASTCPRPLLPPISHKRDISSANINRPLAVSFICVLGATYFVKGKGK